MSFCGYRHNATNSVEYCFWGEEKNLTFPLNEYTLLPPNPCVIQSTISFFTEDPYLDSLPTISDLNEILTREAAEEREEKSYHKFIKDI